MHKIPVAALIGLTVGATALATAQEEPAAEFTPQFSAFPTSPAYYPTRALERGRDGSAVLCCSALDDGSLSCRIENEAPLGLSFGQAAMHMARSMRLTPESASALTTTGQEMRLTVSFHVLEGRQGSIRTRSGSWRVVPGGLCQAPLVS